MKLLLATRNKHKITEIRRILDFPGLVFLTPDDFDDLPDVEEDGDTFEANASKKARELARYTGLPALSDDSGLEVDALNGAPGVHSARYVGSDQDDAANIRKLLTAMKGQVCRTARFHCVLALAEPDGNCRTVESACEGRIINEARGTSGFGYDPLFVPEGYEKTFAELGPEIKDRLSHRARALEKARKEWKNRFMSG